MRQKKIVPFIFALFFCTSLFSQQTFKIWEGTEMTYKQKWSELSVFLPEKEHKTGISVIISPGGSYYWLDMDNEGFSVAKYLNKQGITAFVLHYRTAGIGNNHYPAMIQDLQRAIQLVKENADQYGIDPEKVGVMGFSAGGHLSGTAAEYFKVNLMRDLGIEPKVSLKPAFAGMIYPVVSMEDSICHQKSRRNLLGNKRTPEMEKMMSLEQNVREDMPPIFIVHLTGDKTVDYRNSVVMDQALTKKNIKHDFHLIEENGHGGHGFGIRPNGKATGWIDSFVKWVLDVVNSD
jgi:acetyl esterase/lipase